MSNNTLLDEIIRIRDECKAASVDLIPASDPRGDARAAFKVVERDLTKIIDKYTEKAEMSDITTFIKLVHMLNAEKAEQKTTMEDANGKWVRAGDTIEFWVGLPPVRVTARIEERGGILIGISSEIQPKIFQLRSLRRFVGPWFQVTYGKGNGPGVTANRETYEQWRNEQ